MRYRRPSRRSGNARTARGAPCLSFSILSGRPCSSRTLRGLFLRLTGPHFPPRRFVVRSSSQDRGPHLDKRHTFSGAMPPLRTRARPTSGSHSQRAVGPILSLALSPIIVSRAFMPDAWNYTRADTLSHYKPGSSLTFIETFRDYELTNTPGFPTIRSTWCRTEGCVSGRGRRYIRGNQRRPWSGQGSFKNSLEPDHSKFPEGRRPFRQVAGGEWGGSRDRWHRSLCQKSSPPGSGLLSSDRSPTRPIDQGKSP